MFSPVRPFGELFTPSPRRRSSIQVQFTPMVVRPEARRRSSFVPVNLPCNNRTLVIGVSFFLLVSAVYKSGLIGWIIKVRSSFDAVAEVPLPLEYEISTSASVNEKPSNIVYPNLVVSESVSTSAAVPDSPEMALYDLSEYVPRAEYEAAIHDVTRLTTQVAQTVFRPNVCFSTDKVAEEQLTLLKSQIDVYQQDQGRAEQLEQFQLELIARFNEELSLRNSAIQTLGTRLESLERENLDIITRISFEPTQAVPIQVPTIAPNPVLSTADLVDHSLVSSSVTVFILTVMVTLLSIVCLVLMTRSQGSSVDDLRGELVRESEAAITCLKQDHEKELFAFKALLKESQAVSAELDAVVNEVIKDVSTRHSTPREFPLDLQDASSQFEIWQHVPEEFGGSQECSSECSLGSSLTPIRIPLTASSPPLLQSSPVRFSIASPRRAVDDCSDTSGEQENVQENIASIYDNFKQ